MSELCEKPSRLYLFESAVRSVFSVIATHILAGQVDAILTDEMLLKKLWWFSRYFNPLNLAWRYYSILAYRCMNGKLSHKQIALLNFESHPYKPPIPYVSGELMEDYSVRRLEIAGIFSSQGLLSIIAAYQGLLAVQFTLSSSGFGYLPNVTKALAVLGLFRVLVSPWIANRVHVEYPSDYPPPLARSGMVMQHEIDHFPCFKLKNKFLAMAWMMVLLCLVLLSMRSYIPYPPSSTVPSHLIDRSIELFYNYVSLTVFAFHAFLLSHGSRGLANRHLLFDHWLYHLQTAGFLLLLTSTVLIGIFDFVQHNFYWNCFY